MKTILSLGAGVDSMALLVMAAQGIIHIDEAVMADPGSEEAETEKYWQNVIVPFCFDNGINLARISKDGKPMYETFYEKHAIPTRMHRDCTGKWKIAVIRKYALQKYGKEDKVEFIIGYDASEKERADRCALDGKYPLIEMGIDREGCKKVIRNVEFTYPNKKTGLPIPVKSGCWWCIYKKKKHWIKLLKTEPEKFAKAEALEKNCSRYPEIYLAFPEVGRLEVLRKTYEANKEASEQEKETTQRQIFCAFCEVSDEDGEVDYTGYENFHLQVKSAFSNGNESVAQQGRMEG